MSDYQYKGLISNQIPQFSLLVCAFCEHAYSDDTHLKGNVACPSCGDIMTRYVGREVAMRQGVIDVYQSAKLHFEANYQEPIDEFAHRIEET